MAHAGALVRGLRGSQQSLLGPLHLASGWHDRVLSFDPPFRFPTHPTVIAIELHVSTVNLGDGTDE